MSDRLALLVTIYILTSPIEKCASLMSDALQTGHSVDDFNFNFITDVVQEYRKGGLQPAGVPTCP
jgi:hypothetical protein